MSKMVYLNLPREYKGHIYTIVFDSAAQCAFFLGVNRAAVTLVCQGKRKTIKGMIPSYFDHPPDFKKYDDFPRTHILYNNIMRGYEYGIYSKENITWNENYTFIWAFSDAFPGYF